MSIYNLEAEQQILGAILIDGDSLLKVADIIEPGDFYSGKHQEIYNACLDVYQLEGDVTVTAIVERLKAKSKLDDTGGIGYLTKIASETPTAATAPYHCRVVREKAILRRIKAWALKIGETAEKDAAGDLREFFGEMEQGVISLAETIREKTSPHIQDILREIRDDWQKVQDGQKTHIRTDMKLNSAIPGWYPGHLVVIGGYTSVGKSTFLAQLLVDACEEGARVLIFSTEDARRDKVFKLMANLADITQRRLISGHLDGCEERLRKAESTLQKWGPIIYDDVYSVDEMRLKTKKHKMQGGLDIVAIDFIQNLQGAGSIYERMSDAIIKLQAMAKELQVTVIALSQVNNEAMRQDTEIIGLKGAGELAAAADVILWLKRNKIIGKERWLDCEVRKNRAFGTTGIIPMIFSPLWTRVERRMRDESD